MPKRKKAAKKKASRSKRPHIPQEVIDTLRTAVDSFGDPALEGGTRGGFCYLFYLGDPLCRLGYREDSHEWDFAIYRATTGKYSNADYFLPSRAPLDECIRTALSFYNLR